MPVIMTVPSVSMLVRALTAVIMVMMRRPRPTGQNLGGGQ